MYDLGRQRVANGQIIWTSDTMKVALVLPTYSVNLATHEFVTDLGANILARSPSLSSKTNVAGVLNAANALFASLAGSAFYYLVIFKDTGVDATAPLLSYHDTGTGLGAPGTLPNGADLTVVWDTGASKVLKI
jgi:hypothetical protein